MSSTLPQHRTCPNCGAEVSQRASDCFMCGYEFAEAERKARRLPFADLALGLAIVAVLGFWWRWDSEQYALSQTPTVTPTFTITPTPAPTDTPTPTITPLPSSTPTPGAQSYTVKSGDTYLAIAGAFGITLQDLLTANKLTGKEVLRINQALIIPPPRPAEETLPDATPLPQGGLANYVVQSGDTLIGLAARFQIDISAIMEHNNISDPNSLIAGSVLVIPLDHSIAERRHTHAFPHARLHGAHTHQPPRLWSIHRRARTTSTLGFGGSASCRRLVRAPRVLQRRQATSAPAHPHQSDQLPTRRGSAPTRDS